MLRSCNVALPTRRANSDAAVARLLQELLRTLVSPPHQQGPSAAAGAGAAAAAAATQLEPPLQEARCSRQRPPAHKLLPDAPPPPDIDALIPLYWRQLAQICPEHERLYKPCSARDPAQRSTTNITLQAFSFSGLGVWNTLAFATSTADGQPKTRGGDSWAAWLQDPATKLRIPTRVFDQVGCKMA